jgi:RNA polymerase sigma factor (sigma-70 family)
MVLAREVTDLEFRKAYYGIDEESKKAAADNRGIIKAVLKRYSFQLESDDLESIGMYALWKCLRYHVDGYQKFTTNLYRFVHWECQRELGKKKPKEREEVYAAKRMSRQEEEYFQEKTVAEVREHMTLLPKGWMKKLLYWHFFLELPQYEMAKRCGCSPRIISMRLATAIKHLRSLMEIEMPEYSDPKRKKNPNDVYVNNGDNISGRPEEVTVVAVKKVEKAKMAPVAPAPVPPTPAAPAASTPSTPAPKKPQNVPPPSNMKNEKNV